MPLQAHLKSCLYSGLLYYGTIRFPQGVEQTCLALGSCLGLRSVLFSSFLLNFIHGACHSEGSARKRAIDKLMIRPDAFVAWQSFSPEANTRAGRC
ncbi:uncharacterized protein PHALS_12566 [Plasmopara halstedii]|uniref:Uncharacterized protein n=1 Tax=Plasmopara halstedii TaxID=4781 RepID=A0A0P1ALJ0_PLAHL|nr:uncharacterized protein PHALS_12566 [Plasmopara halstedii]CEG42278.1 hypothetical protein PHALS_12566 [Plasmopara halstedii]|eukprot:XP_024578647.1 hypothetical protein PHALS_12566 [Plasmopara halstedii]